MKNIPKITFVLAIVLLVVAYLIPHTSLEFVLGEGLRPLGLVSIFINPILGIVGGIIAGFKKDWIFMVLNILVIFSLFILMAVGYGMQI